ncbi:MAG TPA: hypothetical protein VH988_34370 [Thermoanaerobaculia bacterium]|nr:hypothetical protein [Thermoanaerobaculia bacterium]
MESLASAPQVAVPVPRATRAVAIPWFVSIMLLGSTSIIVGLLWDISWHMTIGRDTFWTPAHMAIYLGGVLAGLSGGWLAIHTTFAGTPEEKAAAVPFWGFRAPFGAWVGIWGAIAMLTSAPFDDWWHNAYGLDVKIISPPHMVLAAGMIAIQIGAMLLVLARQNRAAESAGDVGERALGLAFLYAAGVVLLMVATVLMEDSYPNDQHGAYFYKASCAVYPLLLAAVAWSSRRRWAATTTAFFYTVLNLVMVWVLPLFPAQPKLAPINNPLDHMASPLFPLLLIVPAVAIDRIVQATGRRARWWLAPALAAAFLGLFLLVQWSFSQFQLSLAADNAFFASNRHWDYSRAAGDWMTQYWHIKREPMSLRAAGVAWLVGTVSAQIGLVWGGWMARVKR